MALPKVQTKQVLILNGSSTTCMKNSASYTCNLGDQSCHFVVYPCVKERAVVIVYLSVSLAWLKLTSFQNEKTIELWDKQP